MLVENGKIVKDALDRELITVPELESMAHRQGFESLDEVQRCIREPGGTLAMILDSCGGTDAGSCLLPTRHWNSRTCACAQPTSHRLVQVSAIARGTRRGRAERRA